MKIRSRIIPSLQITQNKLVKTEKFVRKKYVGDPINTIRVFNEKKVDEIAVTDISASKLKKGPDLCLIKKLASECFMPLSYGGGINCFENARDIFKLGVEKIILKSLFYKNIDEVKKLIENFGSQSICLNIDYKYNKFFKRYSQIDNNNMKLKKRNLFEDIHLANKIGIGEIILNSTSRDGTLSGLDIQILKNISDEITVPLLLKGGCKDLIDAKKAIKFGASGIMGGACFIYHGKYKAVMLKYPSEKEIDLLN